MVFGSLTSAVERGAELSPCKRYRYALWRGDRFTLPLVFLCLNPSTADHFVDDPTVRKCWGFAGRLGASGFWIVNLFGYRATAPSALLDVWDPVGPDNDEVLRDALGRGPVICAWGGSSSTHLRRLVRARLFALWDTLKRHELWCLGGTTKDGSPYHPSRLPYSVELEPWGSSLLR